MKTWAWVVVGAGLATGPAWATVDLNSATANQMEKELGLSRSQAMNIIEHRERQPFQDPSQLSQVNGIDQAKAETLKGKLTANPPSSQATSKATKTKKPKVAKAKTPKAKKTKSARSSKSKKAKPSTTAPVPAPHASAGEGTTHGFALASGASHPHAKPARAAL